MKLHKNSPVIKHRVKLADWKFAKENATKVAVCTSCEIDSDGFVYHDIVAEHEYEDFLLLRDELNKTFGPDGYWTIGGVELGILYPLQTYFDRRVSDISHYLYYVDTRIIVGNNEFYQPSLIDTGAGICHMTFPLWKKLGQHSLFFEENKNLCNLVGIKTEEDITFDNIPLTKRRGTTIGDGSSIFVFPVRIDSIVFKKNKVESGLPVELKDITVNVMNHNETHFISGCNVVKYLDMHSRPIGNNFTITLNLTSDGNILLEKDRIEKNNNYMTHFYNYEDLITVQTPV